MDDKIIIENLKKFFGEFKNRTNRNLLILIIIVTAILIGLIVSYFTGKKTIIIASEDPTPTPTEYIDYSNEEPDADADDSVTTRRYNNDIKNDLTKFLTNLSMYRADHKNRIPEDEDDWNTFYEDYLKNLTHEYTYKNCDFAKGNCPKMNSLTWEKNQLQVIVAHHAACQNSLIVESSGSKGISVYTHLKGETNGVYCISS